MRSGRRTWPEAGCTKLEFPSMANCWMRSGRRTWPEAGCTLAPTIFNLYGCVLLKRWTAQVVVREGVGTGVICKLDGKLFRRSIRSSHHVHMKKCQFADDAASLATS